MNPSFHHFINILYWGFLCEKEPWQDEPGNVHPSPPLIPFIVRESQDGRGRTVEMIEIKRSRHYFPIQPHLIRCGSRPRPERSCLEGKPILSASWTQCAPGPSFYGSFCFVLHLSFIIQLSEVEVGFLISFSYLNKAFILLISVYIYICIYERKFTYIYNWIFVDCCCLYCCLSLMMSTGVK